MTATSSLGSEHEEHLCFVLQERDIPCRRLSSVEQLPRARSHSQVLQLGTHTMMVMTTVVMWMLRMKRKTKLMMVVMLKMMVMTTVVLVADVASQDSDDASNCVCANGDGANDHLAGHELERGRSG